MKKIRIWINFDPLVVDTSFLHSYFLKNDKYEYIEKRIFDHEEAMKLAETTDILINTSDVLNENDIKRLSSKVRLIIRYGTGYENVDVGAATKYGIPFANTPGANAQTVAELALLHILNCGRNFIKSNRGVYNNKWPGLFSGTELEGKILGLMGFGNIAKHLVRLIKGFNLKIIAYDPYAIIEYAKTNNVDIVKTPEELFKKSDIISLHMPVTSETKGLINKQLFDVTKKGIILVNTCRGAVINESDLVEALKNGKVRCAGLDVLAQEPPDWNNPLFKLDNVYLTSHTGGSSEEAEMRTQKIIVETIESYLKGQLSSNVINKNEIEKGK